MSRNKKDPDQIPLSESQNTAITGRTEGFEISINDRTIGPLSDAIKQALFASPRNYAIREANLKEGTCHYVYELLDGPNTGDKHTVKGAGLYLHTLADAFAKLNVHLAFIDNAFGLKGIQVEDIDQHHADELSFTYQVTGFVVKGESEDETVMLKGYKYVPLGRVEFNSTPRIPLDRASSYKWYNELKTALTAARNEVMLYKEGNFEPVEIVDPEPKLKDGKLPFGEGSEATVLDEDFAEARR